jgi:hypothetical protein
MYYSWIRSCSVKRLILYHKSRFLSVSMATSMILLGLCVTSLGLVGSIVPVATPTSATPDTTQSSKTISVIINANPIAIDPSPVVTCNNTQVTITLMGSDADGDDLTYEIDTDPENGNLTYQSEGAADVTYAPSHDFVGDDYFTYFVDDGKAPSENVGMVDIKVDECLPPSEEPPIAVKDIEVKTCEETPLDQDLRKYYDAGSALTFVDVSNPGSGTLVDASEGDGSLIYSSKRG